MINKEMIMDLVYNNPLSLLVIKDKETIDYVNSLIPYSSAFEIECDIVGVGDEAKSYDASIVSVHNQIFRAIPDIMDVQNDSYEQRYRIPNGLRGIICLYNISTQLKIHSLLNPHSSIHYHVDCTDTYNQEFITLVNSSENYILKELDTWLNSPEDATNRGNGSWFKLNSLQTLEFRLGEMTFDYKILLKRIMHCNTIVKKFKDKLQIAKPTFTEIDTTVILNYLKTVTFNNGIEKLKLSKLQAQLNALNTLTKPTPNLPTEEIPVVRNRTHIFKPSK